MSLFSSDEQERVVRTTRRARSSMKERTEENLSSRKMAKVRG
jgi:hypothetical protein